MSMVLTSTKNKRYGWVWSWRCKCGSHGYKAVKKGNANLGIKCHLKVSPDCVRDDCEYVEVGEGWVLDRRLCGVR